MRARACLGIDPGASGGIAIVDPTGMPWAVKMPETLRELWDTLREMKQWGEYETHAVLEQVAARPGQGISSMFKFGQGYGALEMALIAAGIPFRRVTPAVWQKALGCQTGGDKTVSLRKAQELFPKANWGTTKTYNLAIADALLLAEYLRRQP